MAIGEKSTLSSTFEQLAKDLDNTTIVTQNPADASETSISDDATTDDESISSVEDLTAAVLDRKPTLPATQADKDKAAKIKDEANKVLAKGNYALAIELYSQAIELDSEKEVYWANRAQAYIKDEAYGAAIADATKAIDINPDYVKSYYRRALAYTAILRPKDALKDFNTVVQRVPTDKNARAKRDECQKIVRRLAFEAAIEVGEERSVADAIDYEAMVVEDTYDGARLESKTEKTASGKYPKLQISLEFIQDMIERFKKGQRLHRKYVFTIIIEALKIFKSEPTMVEVDIEKSHTLSVCGDTHGQFFDLMELFRFNGYPSQTHSYLFNGDFVDRGSWSTETALLLYAYKWLYPTRFFLNRGNHEADEMNKVYGFEGECKAKYSEKVFKVFSESFSSLPLATLIGRNYFVLHGGLFSDDKITLDDVRKFDRFRQKQPGQSGLMMEMLWTDPQPQPGRGPSKRGVGLQFGPDITKRFCEKNGLMAVIRSHEVRMDGYEIEHGGRLITVFSAPNYCDSQGNKGAVINIKSDYELNFRTYDAVPHPDIKPMAYASNLMM
ncbi:Metallo-dependent phosphatase-like protein [Lipomyces kononenkoae]|uniref:Metallo-dependent phosphatase-like protein n=1 Tax=Lipomyces kononenkoae TaxID=34357 RepID=A0ACC3T536_LIPKO